MKGRVRRRDVRPQGARVQRAARGIPLSYKRLIRSEAWGSLESDPHPSAKPAMTWKLKLASPASQLCVLQPHPLIGHDTRVNTTSHGTSEAERDGGHDFIPEGSTNSQPRKANANVNRASGCIHARTSV